MILTNCAACAAPLAHDAPRCVRCKLRYCKLVRLFARAVLNDQTTSDEKLEATSMLEDAARRMRFICGTSHPETRGFEIEAKQAREIVSRL